jgi:hypothetical protein
MGVYGCPTADRRGVFALSNGTTDGGGDARHARTVGVGAN